MTKTPAWRRYLRFWGSNVDYDVDEELRFHIEMRVEEYVARGMTENEARRAVLERLGDVDAARSECIELGKVRERHARQADFLDGLRADLRFAFRSIRRAPAWTIVALLTIALGIGATTTVFHVADTLLIRPFVYPGASRIYLASLTFEVDGQTGFSGVPFRAVREWREGSHSLEAAAPFSDDHGLLGAGPDAVPINAAIVDTGFLSFAGSRPLLGRNFTAAETAAGGPAALILTERLWRTQFGGSPDVIGQVIQYEGEPHTIVGVTPASLTIPDFSSERADILLPLVLSPHRTYIGPVMVRLKPGVPRALATAELDAIMQRSHITVGRPLPLPMQLRLTRPQDRLQIRQALLMLSGAVGLLLLVACTNVAHLLLARGAARQRELAVCHALGAGRRRLLRQLVTESVLLATIGGALAALVGWGGLELLAMLRPEKMVALSHVSPRHGVLPIAAVLAIACGFVIGLLAALRAANHDLGTSLRGSTSSTSTGGRRLRSALVVGEVAFSTTLLVGALLLIHAVFDLQHTRLGFDASNLYAMTFRLGADGTPAKRAAFGALLRERAARIPGSEGMTLAASAPGIGSFVALSAFETPERPVVSAEPRGTEQNYVAPDYFSMMGMPLIRGRTFDEGSATRNEVIVNRSLARQLWPDGNAIGRRFRNGMQRPGRPAEEWQTVIGVVPDVVRSLIQPAAQPAIYRPLAAADGGQVALLIRMRGADPTATLGGFAAIVNPGSSTPTVESIRRKLEKSIAEQRFTMRILVLFAALGVLLSAVGLFGVISYNVGQRTREIGVRMTLGATRASIARLVVGNGIRLALIGTAVGLLGAVAATRLIRGLLYGVSPLDPFSFVLGSALLLIISVVACTAPMLRATRIDPVIAVRAE